MMRHPSVEFTFVVMLGAVCLAPAIAHESHAPASLLGPLTAQRTATGMTISGTIHSVPAGTKIWVEIMRQPGGPRNPLLVAEDDNVILAGDGTFRATLLTPDAVAFKPGAYLIWIESHFNSAWQTVDVLRKAGVELDSQGQSDIYTDPKAIPASPDFKPSDPEFPSAGRYIEASREVKLEPLPANMAAIDSVKGATLLVQGEGRSTLPVGKSVEFFAHAGGFKPLGWSAELDAGGKCVVTLDCIDGEEEEKAQWSYDLKSGAVTYLDSLAKTISYVPE